MKSADGRRILRWGMLLNRLICLKSEKCATPRSEEEKNMIMRPTMPSEIDAVMRILSDGRASLAALGIDQWQGGYPFRSTVEEDVAAGKSYVVEDEDGALLATAMVDFDGEVTYDEIDGAWLTESTSANPGYACVHRLAVSASGKGRGAAKLVLNEACSMTRYEGLSSVRVDTHPGNVPMRSLLERCGFKLCGVIRIAHAGEDTPERVAYEKRL